MKCKENYNCTCSKKISIIDGDSLPYAYSWMFRDKHPDNEKDLQDLRHALNTGISNMLEETQADFYIGMLAGDPCFRYDCDPNYKGNRGSKTESYELWGDVVKEVLIRDHNFFKLESGCNIEVDDAVGICNTFFLEKEKWDPTIIAVDKDILQLTGKHYNPVKKEFVNINSLGGITKTTSNKKNKINAYGKFLLATQMITGDSTDNITGLHGKGPMFAFKQLNECTNTFQLTKVIAKCYIDQYDKTWKEELKKTFTLVRILDTIKDGEKYNFTPPKPVKVKKVNLLESLEVNNTIINHVDLSNLDEFDLSI